MAMDDAKKKWLTEVGAKAELQQALQARQEQKDAALAKVAGTVAAKAGAIHKGMKKKATRGEGKKAEELDLLADRGGQENELDLEELRVGYRLSAEDTESVLRAGALVAEMSQDLRSMTRDKVDPKTGKVIMEDVIDPDTGEAEMEDVIDPKTKQPVQEDVEVTDAQGVKKTIKRNQQKKKQRAAQEPLFDDKEIGPALYQPLVRQGVLPETLVPDKFSATRDMLDGSFEAYAARLKKEKPKGFWGENKSLIMQGAKSTVGLVSAGVSFQAAGAVKPEDEHKAYEYAPDKWVKTFGTAHDPDSHDLDISPYPDAASTLLEITSQIMEAKEDLSSEGEEAGEKAESEKDADPAKKARAARKARSALVGQQMIAITSAQLAGAIEGVAPDVGVTASSAYGAKVKTAALAKSITEADADNIKKTLAAGYPDAILACDPKTGNSTATMTTAGGKMKTKFEAALNAGELKKALEQAEPDFKKALELVENSADAAAKEGVDVAEFQKLLKDPKSQDGMRKAMDQALTDQFNEEMEEDRKKEEAERAQADQDRDKKADGMKMAGLLEKKIAELKKRQMLIKWAANLGGLGFDIASKAIAPLAIGGSAISLAKNIYQAVQRERDFWAWVESRGDMLRAASAYSSAVKNFVDNASMQAIHYEINAALDLVKIIGAIVECGGISAAAGKAMQATAGAIGAVEAFLYEAKKRYDLETAWKTYKAALSWPENRKVGLIAIKENPTLAKYAVAYGCVVKKDPLVADFMDTCGLDAETLQDPAAKVDKVVSYLEVRMPDDNVVVGRTVGKADWAPTKIELTMACWAGAKKLGETKGELAPLPSRSLDALLAKWDKISAAPRSKKVATADEVKECFGVLDTIDEELRVLNPKDKKTNGNHREMRILIESFRDQVPKCRKEVDAWLPDWAPPKVELTMAGWANVNQLAQTKADLDPIPAGKLDGALTGWDKVPAAERAKATANDAQAKTGLDLLETIQSELKGLSPKYKTSKKPHREMQAVILTLLEEVRKCRKELTG